MKQSFDFEKFRAEAAKSLSKEKDRGKRRESLQTLQESGEYRLAREFKSAESFVTKRIDVPDIEEWRLAQKGCDEVRQKYGLVLGSDWKFVSPEDTEKFKRSREVLTELTERYHKFINEITEGAYLDHHNLNHTVGTSSGHEEEGPPHGNVYFSAGKNNFLSPEQDMLIFSHKNPLFNKFMQFFEDSLNLSDKEITERLEEIKIVDGPDITKERKQGLGSYDISVGVPHAPAPCDARLLPFAYLHNLPMYSAGSSGSLVSVEGGYDSTDNFVPDAESHLLSSRYLNFLYDMADYQVNLDKGELREYDPAAARLRRQTGRGSNH